MSGAQLVAHDDAAVVVPMYDESTVIADVVAGLLPYFTRVVCVDDGSRDQCGAAARAAGATVVRHPVNLGQGAAIETGLRFALRDPSVGYVVTFDADGQHSAADAHAMVARARAEQVQVVLGSRFLGADCHVPAARRALLKAAASFTRRTTGLAVTDAHNGLRVLRRDAASAVALRLHGMSHASEILSLVARRRFSVVEHPVTISYTDYSRAKGQRGYNALNIAFEIAVNRLRPAS
jgi:polyprenyl-phospho-N-acetylgalactosaminyl synthase